ncbi:MAG: hypothetical protein O3A57_12060 [Bacteroidetes bacterium]|nr:hypothetical protein [Bacteroidota bacterium]
MKVALAGYDHWIDSCRRNLPDEAEVRVLTEEDLPEPDEKCLLSGSSGDWYPMLDRALRQGRSVLLGNPGSWSHHDLQSLEHVAEESGVDLFVFRPWRSALNLAPKSHRIIQLDVPLGPSERWKPVFGQAIDLVIHALGTSNLLRADASRATTESGQLALLLATLRFQNGSFAHVSIASSDRTALRLTTSDGSLSMNTDSEASQLGVSIGEYLFENGSLPKLQHALAGRKIEENIISILRTS